MIETDNSTTRRTVTYSIEVEVPDLDPRDCADVLRTLVAADVGRVVGASWTTYTYQDSDLPTPVLSSIVSAETIDLPIVRDEGRAVRDSPQA